MTILRPTTEPEYASWMADVVPAYAADKVASGQWSEAEALALSRQEFAELLPEGLATAENHLFTIADDESRPVGVLWFALKTKQGSRIAYVYDVSVVPHRQREGHAWRAFLALEDKVRELGLTGIALHVFGHNLAARALYAKLGYQPTNISLFKRVGSGCGGNEV